MILSEFTKNNQKMWNFLLFYIQIIRKGAGEDDKFQNGRFM